MAWLSGCLKSYMSIISPQPTLLIAWNTHRSGTLLTASYLPLHSFSLFLLASLRDDYYVFTQPPQYYYFGLNAAKWYKYLQFLWYFWTALIYDTCEQLCIRYEQSRNWKHVEVTFKDNPLRAFSWYHWLLSLRRWITLYNVYDCPTFT